MRDFIKKQIQERMNIASKNNEPESVPNEAILEYASLFQELDDGVLHLLGRVRFREILPELFALKRDAFQIALFYLA